MDHSKIYDDFIVGKRKEIRVKIKGDDLNRHHIIPKCMGGNEDKENLILLTWEEHFEAHEILARIYPEHEGILGAYIMMSGKNKGEPCNKEEYAERQKVYAEIKRVRMTGKTKETCPIVAQQTETRKGRTKENHEGIAKQAAAQSKSKKGQTAENCDRVRRTAETNRGKTKESCPGLAMVSVKASIRQKGQTAENCDRVRRTAETRRGRTKNSHEGIARQSEALSILKKEQRIELVKLRNEGKSFKEISLFFSNLLGIFLDSQKMKSIFYKEELNEELKEKSYSLNKIQDKKEDHKISHDEIMSIIDMRNKGISFSEIHQWVVLDLNKSINKDSLVKLYKRESLKLGAVL